MTRTLTALPLALVLAAPGLAQDQPPASAIPLSEIVRAIEDSEPVLVVLGVEWEDEGYWELEYIDTGNRRVEIRVDPATAAILPR